MLHTPPPPSPPPIQCAHVGRRTWCNPCFLTSTSSSLLFSFQECCNGVPLHWYFYSPGGDPALPLLSLRPLLLVCFVWSGQKGPRSPLLHISFVNPPPPMSFSHCLPAGKIKRWVFMSGPKSPLSSPLTVPMATSSSDGGCLLPGHRKLRERGMQGGSCWEFNCAAVKGGAEREN